MVCVIGNERWISFFASFLILSVLVEDAFFEARSLSPLLKNTASKCFEGKVCVRAR